MHMRRSERRKTKSLKAELEGEIQSKCKQLKCQSLTSKAEGGHASDRTTRADAREFEEESCVKEDILQRGREEEMSEESKLTEHYHRKVSSSHTVEDDGIKVLRNRRKSARINKRAVYEVSSDSDTVEVESEVEEEEEEEGVSEVEEVVEEEEGVSEEEEGVGESETVSRQGRWAHYPSLCASLPGREQQIQLLLTVMGELHTVTCPAIHVYGNTATGKTLTLKTILTTLQAPHAFVNCIECYSSKLLYREILRQLTVESCGSPRCDSMPQFIHLLQKYADENGLTNTTVYIVLDKAERLREMGPTLLPALLRLSELTKCQVCTILISELVWEKFYMDTGGLSPYPLHFPQYTQSEVLTIMYRDCPAEEPLSFYKTFVNHIWNVFQCVCRDLGELRHLSSLLYPKYCEPVETGEIGRQETRKLWRHIEPYFRGVMSKIYLREISTAEWERTRRSQLQRTTSSAIAQGLCQSRCALELPHFSKYLLIATYLASYNPSKTDKKFFSKKQARSRKSKKPLQQKEKPNYQLLGPKPFPLDRLLAIFYSITDDSITPSADIFSQISSLVSLQLICQLHTRDPLDAPKYKCLLTLHAVQKVSRSIGFDLVQYLYDFN